MYVLPFAGRVRTLCNLRLQCLPYERENDFSLEYLSHRILTLYWQGRFGAVSRRGICHIWFRGRHISPSMPYREARSVAESSEGPTASKSDRTGRNPGMTRLVRRSSAGCLEVLRFSLLFKHSVSACVNVLALRYLLLKRVFLLIWKTRFSLSSLRCRIMECFIRNVSFVAEKVNYLPCFR